MKDEPRFAHASLVPTWFNVLALNMSALLLPLSGGYFLLPILTLAITQ